MSFLVELKAAIQKNQPLPPLLASCIRPPKKTNNVALNMFKVYCGGEEKFKVWLSETIKDNLYSVIKENQPVLELLNSVEGRKYLHSQLDALLSYLVSDKFNPCSFSCPACKKPIKKSNVCNHCGIKINWVKA